MKRHIEEILFTEKYRPLSIKDIILPDRLRKRFEKGLSDFPRVLMFSYSAGTGKCLSINTLVKIRNKISGKIQEISIEDFLKIIEK
jgi:hypothetical protein